MRRAGQRWSMTRATVGEHPLSPGESQPGCQRTMSSRGESVHTGVEFEDGWFSSRHFSQSGTPGDRAAPRRSGSPEDSDLDGPDRSRTGPGKRWGTARRGSRRWQAPPRPTTRGLSRGSGEPDRETPRSDSPRIRAGDASPGRVDQGATAGLAASPAPAMPMPTPVTPTWVNAANVTSGVVVQRSRSKSAGAVTPFEFYE